MIPLPYYTAVFNHTLLAIVLLTVGALAFLREESLPQGVFKTSFWALLLAVIFYMGLRPISGIYFGDMGTYARDFERARFALGTLELNRSDSLFLLFLELSAAFLSVDTWFLLCAALYVGLMAWAVHRVHGPQAYLALLVMVASYSFWGYGVNGIRNGLATSLVLLGMAYRDRKAIMFVLFGLALGTHASVALPVSIFLLGFVIRSPWFYLIGYALAIPLSLIMGGWWESWFASLGLFGDARFSSYLLDTTEARLFSATGFRWDFVLYSVSPILFASWQLFHRQLNDRFYTQLVNTYVGANAFWVLVIRASFSNRFAYLSWFLMPWVFVYPFLTGASYPARYRALGVFLLAYYLFTYFMVA